MTLTSLAPAPQPTGDQCAACLWAEPLTTTWMAARVAALAWRLASDEAWREGLTACRAILRSAGLSRCVAGEYEYVEPGCEEGDEVEGTIWCACVLFGRELGFFLGRREIAAIRQMVLAGLLTKIAEGV